MWIITEAKKHVPSALEKLRAKNTTLLSFSSSLNLLLRTEYQTLQNVHNTNIPNSQTAQIRHAFKPICARVFWKRQFYFRWLLGLRKLRSSEKVEIFQIGITLWVALWKNIIFYFGRKNSVFSMILFSTAISYLTTYSTLNFIWTSLCF